MDPELNPDDALAALGITSPEEAPGQGYQMPATDPELPSSFTRPGEGMPQGQRNGALEQARVLASLAGGGKTSKMDRFASGLGAKTGAAPANPVAAALDGGISGFTAAYGAGKGKGGLSDIKERMGLLKTLFDMDRSLARDKSANSFRERALDISERRLDQSAGGRGGGDPVLREARIATILKNHPAAKALEDGLDPTTGKRLTTEQRAALQKTLDGERERLTSLGGTPQKAPATTTPQQNVPSVDSSPPSVKPAPKPPVDVAPPAAAPKVAAQPAPKTPALSREQVIEQGRAANQRGIPLDAIIGRAKERGFDLTTDDFLKTPQPAPQPNTQAPTDPNGAVVGPQSMAPQDVMGLLQTLLG